MRFSQRIGKRKVKTELEKEGLSPELRNSLWTLILELIINSKSNERPYEDDSELTKYFRDLWIYFFKWPIDNLPMSYGTVIDYKATLVVRKYFFESDWDLALDFVEFTSEYNPKFREICNGFLKREMSSYRFVDENLVEVNSAER